MHLLIAGTTSSAPSARPSEATSSDWARKGRETGLPIPRFVSLKADNARMRIGPAFEYAIEWLYQAPGLPLEIIEEYGYWRQVRDCDGITGWMHKSLLSSTRTAVVAPWLKSMASLRARPSETGSAKAKLEPRVRVRVLSCLHEWCHVATKGDSVDGYVEKSDLWGVYPQERIN
ncbi:SH3 domain-containing protein [Ensifer sp. B1-9]|uniref:SH3 domain-containing protein n=1 Tax=Ensifer sp. B1-9 TaxID=3141455 RepID=UPI003D232E28